MPPLTSDPLMLMLTALTAYLLGSVPFGLVIARLMGLGNLRKIGSGNIGATNVLRTGNRPAAFLTLVLDAGKGAAAVLVARCLLAGDAALLAGLAAVLGHLFPVWLGFRGGKGVATCLGILLALSVPVGLCTCLTWLAVAATLRISSLAALVAVASAPVWMVWTGYAQGILTGLVLIVLIYAKHLPNIRRLAAGSEPRIGGKG